MKFWKEYFASWFSLCVALVATDFDPCESQNHNEIYYDVSRNVHFNVSSSPLCDQYIAEAWYRFDTGGDDRMPTYPVQYGKCGTTFPIWINGELPQAAADGITNLTTCVSDFSSTCSESWTIQAKSCDTFYVYKLVDTPGCDMAYCVGLDPLPVMANTEAPDDSESDPCDATNYAVIDDQLWRNVHVERVSGSSKCDRYMEHRWYRFNVQDDFMPTFPVSPGMCGTTFPIWIQGSLPTSHTEGTKTVSVCTATYNNQCQYSWDIEVKRCNGYHVYKLQPTPGCDMVYCIGVNIPLTEVSTATCNDSNADLNVDEQLHECQEKHADTEKDVNSWKTATFVCITLLAVAVVTIGGLLYYTLFKSRRSQEAHDSHSRLREGSSATRESKVSAADMYDLPIHRQTPPPQYEWPSSLSRPASGGMVKSSHK